MAALHPDKLHGLRNMFEKERSRRASQKSQQVQPKPARRTPASVEQGEGLIEKLAYNLHGQTFRRHAARLLRKDAGPQ